MKFVFHTKSLSPAPVSVKPPVWKGESDKKEIVFTHMQIIKHPNSALEPSGCFSSGRFKSFQQSHASSKETEFQFLEALGLGRRCTRQISQTPSVRKFGDG